MSNLIEAVALAKGYGPQEVLHEVTLTIPSGQVAVLFGGNGAGKTVLLKLLAGLVAPDAGSVRLNGYDLVTEHPQALPQVAIFMHGLQQMDDERRVGEGLSFPKGPAEPFRDALGLEAYGHLTAGALSNGLRQQVTLARILSNDRPILLLDEPLRGLDRPAADTFRAWIRHLAHGQGRTAVVATCDPHLPLALGDRLVLLRHGRIVSDILLDRPPRLDQPAYYRIHVKGSLEARWSSWFDGLTVTSCKDETAISGLVMDQPALHSLLMRVRDLGLLLLSVQRFNAGVEEIFE